MSSQRIIIIENDSAEKKYAETMLNRVKTSCGEYSASLWSAKEYEAQKTTISDMDKVIFFGKAQRIDSCAKDDSIRWKMNKFGMKYGWAGNVCVLGVSTIDDWKKFLEGFRKYCISMSGKYSDVPIPETSLVEAWLDNFKKGEHNGFRYQYPALLHEFLDGGGFDSFIAKANTDIPVFKRIVDQLPDVKNYPYECSSNLSWETLEARDGYKIQVSTERSVDCFRIINRENELIAWGKRSIEALGLMAFLALFEEKIIIIVEQDDPKKQQETIYSTLDSLKPIEKVINEADEALKDKARTIKDSGDMASILAGAIPEVAAGFIGGAIGAGVSFAALYCMGSVAGFSAAGITSGLKAIGAIINGGMLHGIFLLSVPIVVLSTVGTAIARNLQSKALLQAKELLLKIAVEKQQMIIAQLKAEVDAIRQRSDYLNSLNELLRRIIVDLKADLGAGYD